LDLRTTRRTRGTFAGLTIFAARHAGSRARPGAERAKAIGLAAVVIGGVGWPSIARSDAPSSEGRGAAPIVEPPRPISADSTDRDEEAPCAQALRISAGCASTLGLRGSASSTSGVSARDGVGLMVWSEGEYFTQGPVLNAHGMHRFALGGGSAGLEGTLLGGLTGGFRIPVAARHGAVVRAGAFGYVRGNDAFYASLLELPRIEIGYQLRAPTVVVELGIDSGAVLTGRSRMGDTYARHVGSGGLTLGLTADH